jgi:hypothetical protein
MGVLVKEKAVISDFLALVRTAGLEPAPGCPEQILSLLRLPFRHVRFGQLYQCLIPQLPSPFRTGICRKTLQQKPSNFNHSQPGTTSPCDMDATWIC